MRDCGRINPTGCDCDRHRADAAWAEQQWDGQKWPRSVHAAFEAEMVAKKMAVDTGELQVNGDEQDIRASRDMPMPADPYALPSYADLYGKTSIPAPGYHQHTASKDTLGPGYHLNPPDRGEIGEISKIREELAELEDAAAQGVKVMELVEISDLIGAIECYLEKHHPGTTLNDAIKMKDVTRRAFKNGRRK